MDRKLAVVPLLLVAGTSLSGCVAAAIPAIAGSAMVGSRVVEGEEGAAVPVAAASPAVAAPAPATARPASVPAPSIAVARGPAPPAAQPAATPVPDTARNPATPAPTPAAGAPAGIAAPPASAAAAPPTAAARSPRPAPDVATSAQVTSAEVPPAGAAIPRSPARPDTGTAPAPALAGAPAVAAAPLAAYPDPARPIPASQNSFARFVRYGQATARGAAGGADLLSAMLADPVALDGKRRRCAVGEQLVALIDLDPAGGIFTPPANPARQPGLALGLAVLREAGVEIAWLSDMPVSQSGALRSALEKAGLDPRGEDIISLRRDGGDGKQARKDNLAGIACIIAIAGDERPDFDERYKYLRNPEAGAGLEPVIGDGWFLIEPLLASQGQ